MTHASIADYDPLAYDSEDDSPDPIEVWLANRPFEERNRMLNPVNAATAKKTRITQLRLEIQSLEFTVINAEALLVGRRDELAGLTGSRPSGETVSPSQIMETPT
jgi:hypothetical protein